MDKTQKNLNDHKKISPVAPNTNKSIGGVIVIVLAVIGIIYMVTSDTKKVIQKEEDFNPAYSFDNDFTKRIEKIEKEQKRKKKILCEKKKKKRDYLLLLFL